jgi:glycosyltransferase involved in cell wall biosynthesis
MKQNRLFIISNMYPSKKNPSYGIFVRNFVETFACQENISVHRTALLQKKRNSILKGFAYCFFYFEIILKGIFCSYDTIYVHFISHSSIPVFIVKFFRPSKKLILNTHGSDIINKGFLFNLYMIFVRRLMDKSNLIVVPSKSFIKEVQSVTSPKNFDKIKCSYSGGVDTVKFSPLNSDIGKGGPFVLGYVSRITKEKGCYVFLEAIQLIAQSKVVRNLSVVIVGSGVELNNVKSKVSELGLEDVVTFLGELSQKELPKLYNSFDLFVFPSYRESLGLVGIEALSCGIPVIGSSINGIKEYLEEGLNGFLFQTGDPHDLQIKIIHYWSLNEVDKRKMSRYARETALNFDENKVLSDLIFKINSI